MFAVQRFEFCFCERADVPSGYMISTAIMMRYRNAQTHIAMQYGWEIAR
jgi:hypothetical protein